MNARLEGFESNDLPQFDEALVNILQSESLMEEMEELFGALTEHATAGAPADDAT